jgi:hypothetical protein
LGQVTAPSRKVKTCPDYNFFLTNFPMADYFDKFKTSFETKITDFISKEMENNNEAIKRKN